MGLSPYSPPTPSARVGTRVYLVTASAQAAFSHESGEKLKRQECSAPPPTVKVLTSNLLTMCWYVGVG